MNKDDPELYPFLRKEPIQNNNAALDLLSGLETRSFGNARKNAKPKEGIEMYAEEQFIRKQDFNEMRCEMPGLPRSTFLMVFSPDGSRVASTHGNHNIYITDIRTGKHIRTLIGHPRTPWCIAFHPTSNQIVASGCLGGQVRIWDLSGGSEVWTAVNQTVIASLAFHPRDRVLVIATYNEVYFWDWSQPEPFVHVATSNPKEKVRFVAFDILGHKLITGIANSPQTRWERVRAPVPVPRQERSVSPFRRRITHRLQTQNTTPTMETTNSNNRDSMSSVPERERRITVCYRNLVREYEQLVERYLQLYRPPRMIDRGTDPMEPNIQNPTPSEPQPSTSRASEEPGPSTSGTSNVNAESLFRSQLGSSSDSEGEMPNRAEVGSTGVLKKNPGSSTSRTSASNTDPSFRPQPDNSSDSEPETSVANRISQGDAPTPTTSAAAPNSSHLLTPSRIFSVLKKPSTLIRGTQTSESRKHKADSNRLEPKGKRLKKSSHPTSNVPGLEDGGDPLDSSQAGGGANEGNSDSIDDLRDLEESRLDSVRRLMGFNKNLDALRNHFASSNLPFDVTPAGIRIRIPFEINSILPGNIGINSRDSSTLAPEPSNTNAPSTSESGTQPSRDVDELLFDIRRTAEEEVRSRILPIIRSVPEHDRPELIRLFENSREHVRMRFRNLLPVVVKKQPKRYVNVVDTTSDSSSSDDEQSPSFPTLPTRRNSEPSTTLAGSAVGQNSTTSVSSTNASTSNPNVSSNSTVRNFNTELEQLVTSLLTEIERNESGGGRAGTNSSNSNVNTQTIRNNTLNRNSPSADSPVPTAPSGENHSAPAHPPSDSTSASSRTVYPRPLQGYFPRFNSLSEDSPFRTSSSSTTPGSPAFQTPPANNGPEEGRSNPFVNLNYPPRRRRFFSHRISAFMPTRVNYNRSPTRARRANYTLGRGRAGVPRSYNTSSFDTDELINYSERENSEEELSQPLDLSNHPTSENGNAGNVYSNVRLGNVYSNIIHDLESSLSDIIRMRTSNRPGETSDMLGSFSERLENIMQQSDTILRNLSSSMEMLSNTAEPNAQRTQASEPIFTFSDQNFYVRDQRNDASPQETNREDTINLGEFFSNRPHLHPVVSDHTYPRNPENAHSSTQGEGISPLMHSIQLTISYIQRQARLLRRQVESIERIDRAMLEVAQLQLIRQLIIELVQHVRNSRGEHRAGMSSVRQMMAGTRISDSSPYESPAEEGRLHMNPQPGTSSSTAFNAGEHVSGSGGATRPRSSNRKTYPPGRLLRLARQYRRPSIVHFFSRRYVNRNERNFRQNPQVRSTVHEALSTARNNLLPNYINTHTLSSMTRRLQHLLIEQVRVFTSAPQNQQSARSPNAVDLEEHILATRLHACVLRVNRLTGSVVTPSAIGNLTATADGELRYRARHTLSTIIENMIRHIEELGGSSIPVNIRTQFHGVLVMSLLLTELLLLVIVDSIPPPSGINLFPERASLTSRIDQICNQMLQSRNFSNCHQLTRSLKLMKLTMRHAHSALGQTYHARRNEMLPRVNTNMHQVLGSINRCLRFINRQRDPTDVDQNTASLSSSTPPPDSSGSAENPDQSNADAGANSGEWYSNIYDFFLRRYPNNNDDGDNQPSTSARDRAAPPQSQSSTNDNTDGEDDETDGYNNNYIPHSSNLYRTSNVNVSASPGQQPRPWNVPSVQVNDVPVTEPIFAQRIITQRQRFAERISELRSHPIGLFRPRFLHPLYASVMNPFDADLDDPQREPLYDSDMITTVTPNHRIQAWDVSDWTVPVPEISDALKNVVVGECKIHNDASVDVAKDGTILVTLLPSGGYLNVTNRLGVYSLRWETLGQCLYTTSFEQNAVSVSLSPLSRHLIVGLTHRIITSDRWIMARVFKIDQKDVPGDRLPVLRELEQNRDSRINCIRWLPTSGQGLIYATNTGQLVVLS